MFDAVNKSEKILTSKASLEYIIESYKLLRKLEDFSFYLVAYLMVVPPPPPPPPGKVFLSIVFGPEHVAGDAASGAIFR